MLAQPAPANGVAENHAHDIANLSFGSWCGGQGLEPLFNSYGRDSPEQILSPTRQNVVVEDAAVHEFCSPRLSLVYIHWHFLDPERTAAY